MKRLFNVLLFLFSLVTFTGLNNCFAVNAVYYSDYNSTEKIDIGFNHRLALLTNSLENPFESPFEKTEEEIDEKEHNIEGGFIDSRFDFYLDVYDGINSVENFSLNDNSRKVIPLYVRFRNWKSYLI